VKEHLLKRTVYKKLFKNSSIGKNITPSHYDNITITCVFPLSGDILNKRIQTFNLIVLVLFIKKENIMAHYLLAW